MTLCFLLDEQLRGGALWQAIQQHNAGGADVLDVIRVGDGSAPPLGMPDPGLLLWAEANGRILITRDKQTMPRHLADHLQAGHHSPGVFLLRAKWTTPLVLASLVLRDQAGDPATYIDQIEYIP